MTIDVRANVFCNLGTVIQASVADEAISARQGLIRCRGQVVLHGISTPAVGGFVYFGWERDGTIARVPRTLRVLSSFANPLTNQTTVQLGDKLTYLANLKGRRADPKEQDPKPETPDNPAPPTPGDPPTNPDQDAFPFSTWEYDKSNQCYFIKKDERPALWGTPEAASVIRALEQYLDAPASIRGQVPLTIPAEAVLGKCLKALGITKTGAALIAQFTVDSFDLSSGYVNVIDQLLANESLYGYLNENEVLVIGQVDNPAGSGPLLDASTLIQIEGINQGILPGQQVTVSLENRAFSPQVPPAPAPPPAPKPDSDPDIDPDDPLQGVDPQIPEEGTPEDDLAQRNWEIERSVTDGEEAIFFLEDGTSFTFGFQSSQVVRTNYDDDGYVKSRITINSTGGANFLASVIQAKLQAAYDAAGGNGLGAFNVPGEINALAGKDIQTVTFESFFYKTIAKERIPVPFRSSFCSAANGPIIADKVGSDRVEKVLVRQVSQTTTESAALIGQLSLGAADWSNDALTVPGGIVVTERVEVDYELDQPTGRTKTVTKRFRAAGNLQQGQSDAAVKGLAITAQQELEQALNAASELRLESTTVAIQEDRTFGVQQRPSIEQLTSDAAQVEPPTGAEADENTNTVDVAITEESGTIETQPTLDTSMPFGSDDGFIWTASDGFQFKGSNASALALRYARAQNAILRGNRNGLSLQIPAYAMPLYPLSYVYIQAAGVTGGYRSNGMSWAMTSEGILCSMDALFWGGVGGSGTAWFPVAPGITALPADPSVTLATAAPANSTGTPAGFNPTAPAGIFSVLPVGQAPTYAQSIAPVALVPIVVEKVKAVAAVKSVIAVRTRDYSLTLPTVSVVLRTRSLVIPATVLSPQKRTFLFTGYPADFRFTKGVKADAGTFRVDGQNASDLGFLLLKGDAAFFDVNGYDAALKQTRNPLIAAEDSFNVNGQNAQFFKGAALVADRAAFVSTGLAATLLTSRVLKGDVGAIDVSGQAAGLGFVLPSDPFFSSVQLLLKGEGTNGGSTITDLSSKAYSPSVNSGTVTSTAAFKYGSSSLLFNPPSALANRGLTYTINSASTFGTGDYTIELFFRLNGTDRLGYLFCIDTFEGFLTVDASNNIRWINQAFTPSSALAANTWYHLAAVRNSSTVQVYLNGSQIGSSVTSTRNSTGTTWWVGRDFDTDNGFAGYIDELRVTKGVARYTANFTPPTRTFPEQ